MKNIAIAILIVVLLAVFIQPLIETANVLKEKVTIGAAILNSCRAARNNSLTDDRLRDMDAFIDKETFKTYFAEAFAKTLDLDPIYPLGDPMYFTSQSGRWNRITVSVDFENDEIGDFDDRYVSRATIEIETPYVFRTTLLKAVNSESAQNFNITETRRFLVQIIN